MRTERLDWEDNLTLPNLLQAAASQCPNNTAIDIDGTALTYHQLLEGVEKVSAQFLDLGLAPGDRIAILMQNSTDLLLTLFGAAYIGITSVIINARFAAKEIAHVINNSKPVILFVGNHGSPIVNLPERVHNALQQLPESARRPDIYVLGTNSNDNSICSPSGFRKYSLQQINTEIPRGRIRELASFVVGKEIYFILYTSGTTADPKGCLIKHESMVSNGMMVGRDHFSLNSTDIMWNVLPMFHVSSLAPLHATIDAGASFISALHFDPSYSLDVIETKKCTVLFPSYPAIMQPIITEITKKQSQLAHVNIALTAGPPENLLKYQEQLPKHIIHISCYGSTEIGGIGTMGLPTDPLSSRIATGKPLRAFSYEIRDLETNQKMESGKIGELWVRSKYLFVGYDNNPEATSKAFDANGWFDTGDLALIDEYGNIFHKGRSKDMLKVGGENVAAAEVESALLTHPSIAIAAVVGKPDERYQEVPVAFIELQPGYYLNTDELTKFLTEKLAKYKIPKEFHTVTEWPMSATKIQKFKLLETLNK